MRFVRKRLHPVESLVFVDKKVFDSNERGERRVWAMRGVTLAPVFRQNYAPRVHVFIATGYNFRFIHFFGRARNPDTGRSEKQRVTSAVYKRNCIRPILPALQNGFLVQDNSRVHTSREMQRYYAEHGVRVIEGWPPRSPDLNPVENLFADLQNRLSMNNFITQMSEEDLQNALMQEFNAFPVRRINNLVKSFPKWVEKVKQMRGGFVK